MSACKYLMMLICQCSLVMCIKKPEINTSFLVYEAFAPHSGYLELKDFSTLQAILSKDFPDLEITVEPLKMGYNIHVKSKKSVLIAESEIHSVSEVVWNYFQSIVPAKHENQTLFHRETVIYPLH